VELNSQIIIGASERAAGGDLVRRHVDVHITEAEIVSVGNERRPMQIALLDSFGALRQGLFIARTISIQYKRYRISRT
jgi:hypothetical protein